MCISITSITYVQVKNPSYRQFPFFFFFFFFFSFFLGERSVNDALCERIDTLVTYWIAIFQPGDRFLLFTTLRARHGHA